MEYVQQYISRAERNRRAFWNKKDREEQHEANKTRREALLAEFDTFFDCNFELDPNSSALKDVVLAVWNKNNLSTVLFNRLMRKRGARLVHNYRYEGIRMLNDPVQQEVDAFLGLHFTLGQGRVLRGAFHLLWDNFPSFPISSQQLHKALAANNVHVSKRHYINLELK